MPIRVRHDPDIELLGEMAYDTGRGRGYQRERERYDQLLREYLDRMERGQARTDQYADRERDRLFRTAGQRNIQRQRGQEFTAQQGRLREESLRADELARLGLGQAQEKIDLGRLAQDDQNQYYMDLIAQRREAADQEEQLRKQGLAAQYNAEWKLTDEQQELLKKKQKTQFQLQNMLNRNELSQAQYNAATQQLEQQIPASMLEKQLVPREKPPVDEQFWERAFRDKTGIVFGLDPNERPILVYEPDKADKNVADTWKQWKDSVDLAIKTIGDPDLYPPQAELPYPEALRSLAQDYMAGPTIRPEPGGEAAEQAIQELVQQFNISEQQAIQVLQLYEQAQAAHAAGDIEQATVLQEQLRQLIGVQ